MTDRYALTNTTNSSHAAYVNAYPAGPNNDQTEYRLNVWSKGNRVSQISLVTDKPMQTLQDWAYVQLTFHGWVPAQGAQWTSLGDELRLDVQRYDAI